MLNTIDRGDCGVSHADTVWLSPRTRMPDTGIVSQVQIRQGMKISVAENVFLLHRWTLALKLCGNRNQFGQMNSNRNMSCRL